MNKPLALQNREAEEALLGAMLINPGAYGETDEIIKAEDLSILRNRWDYEAIGALTDAGRAVDFLTLSAELERTGKLAEIGGAVYLVMLINQPPNSLYALEYAHLIVDAAGRRRLLEAANQIAQLEYSSHP